MRVRRKQRAGFTRQPNLTFTIHVRNYAGVDSTNPGASRKGGLPDFPEGRRRKPVGRRGSVPGQDSDNAPDQQAVGLSDLRVNILPAAMSDQPASGGWRDGLAPGAGPDRVLAYIFYNRVEEMQQMHLAAISAERH